MKAYILKDSDFEELEMKIELHYRKRCENASQPWSTSFAHDDPRGKSIYDQFRGTWYELQVWKSRVTK
jgi:hypothetical protein